MTGARSTRAPVSASLSRAAPVFPAATCASAWSWKTRSPPRQPSSSFFRRCTTSRSGGAPNSRLYSRLNCDALS